MKTIKYRIIIILHDGVFKHFHVQTRTWKGWRYKMSGTGAYEYSYWYPSIYANDKDCTARVQNGSKLKPSLTKLIKYPSLTIETYSKYDN